MVLNILILVIGMFLLIKGADLFVDGASTIAKYLKISALIIGLTIVSLGTSLPELAVSFASGLSGKTELSVANVVGSNIFNTLVVLGCSALFMPVMIEKKIVKFELPVVIIASVLLLVFGLIGTKAIEWYWGLLFLIMTIGYIVFLIFRGKKENKDEPVEEEEEKKMPLGKAIILSIVGVAIIALGGKAVEISATELAREFGMDEKLIGLTVVAIGTSLPELVTSIVAAKKGENDIALGNVIGSNTLNILFILGVTALLSPLPISSSMMFDIIVAIGVMVLILVMALFTMKKKGLGVGCGITLIALYVVYLAYSICVNYNILPPLIG